MSVVIRLSRAGRVHLPYYHIGVYNSRTRRDGRPVEQLGFYDPKSTSESVRLDLERARYWLSVGARPSATVAGILKRQGVALPKQAPGKRKSAAGNPTAKKEAAPRKPGAKGVKVKKSRTASSKLRSERRARAAGGK